MAEREEEVEVLVQRVVKDITNALKRNPNIDEIGVIPCPEARYNRSPIVLVENKLGVESWCVKFLLPYVHNKLLLYRQRKVWMDREALVDITCTVLLLNPDFTTAWNVRKELLQCGVLNPEKDLYLGKLALTKSPKSPETWIHRRWVLQQVLDQFSAPAPCRNQQQKKIVQDDTVRNQQLCGHLARTLHQEMKVCSDAACRYPSNYNAWSHRIWVLQHMAKGNVKIFHDELSSMRMWVSMHVSDHSGFHYRQYLLKELIAELSQSQASTSTNSSPQHHFTTVTSSNPHHCINFQVKGRVSGAEGGYDEEKHPGLGTVFQHFQQEMDLCSDLIQSFPGHEALWCHRRHVFYLWHHWRRDHKHLYYSCTEGIKSLHCSTTDLSLSNSHAHSCGGSGDSVNGHASGSMDLDGGSLPDPRNSKRLKRGVLPPSPPVLHSEHGFVCHVLDTCCNPEQRRFALAYRKWLDTVIGQQP
ncbi:protein prenyltransferase alpha subunit repeat-containing protein 1 [Thalassophryne amazonica]|uniref:protein prenyltransferase alpha subunit repeat-containing protein 1 n=1 Tax=Thalassophryne amazonica TaxID=390379 RepID=UPI0014725F69|nr:protein prenyltransferase alpha subunit repeat-containing protein 1 [Thalassophryne amazonica]